MDSLVQEALKQPEQKVEAKVGHANIVVCGCGGGGSNAIDWLYKKGVRGAEIIAVNTDKQHLDMVEADKKLLIGRELTRGLGCGGFPKKGMEAAKEQIREIKDYLKAADMVFITAGLGGGTGTGAAPVIAKVAKDSNAIVIGTVTMPFEIERTRLDKAEWGLQQLRDCCDTVIVIDNNRLTKLAGNLPIKQAFAVANELISTMIKGIVEIIAIPSLVNLDYADVKAVMTDGGVSVIGIGEADSENRVDEAVNRALKNPLLDVDSNGDMGALIHVSGGPDLTLDEVNRAGELIAEALDPEANVVWGSRIESDMKGRMRVMTIITGVSSPYVLGKPNLIREEFHDPELGIDML
jgi:cell division protein FtsZ